MFYGRDLTDVMEPGTDLTPRRCLAYIATMPFGSATNAALQGGQQYRGWTPDTYMMANVVDATTENTYVLVKANSKKHARVDRPKPVERPKTLKKKSEPKNNRFAAMARMAYRASRKDRKDA